MELTLERIEDLRKYAAKVAALVGGDCITKPDELLALLDSARALARLEAHEGLHAVLAEPRIDGTWQVELNIDCEDRPWVTGPDLATAIHAALDGAEVRE